MIFAAFLSPSPITLQGMAEHSRYSAVLPLGSCFKGSVSSGTFFGGLRAGASFFSIAATSTPFAAAPLVSEADAVVASAASEPLEEELPALEVELPPPPHAASTIDRSAASKRRLTTSGTCRLSRR